MSRSVDMLLSDLQLERLASGNGKLQKMNQGERYRSAYPEFKRLHKAGDFEAAFQMASDLATEGCEEVQVYLGRMYLGGIGTLQNTEQAIHWLEKAANRQDAMAQFVLGHIFVGAKDYEKAHEWLNKAKENGYPPAICRLGFLYRYGRGVPKNMAKSHELFKAAAEKGNLVASIKYAVDLMCGKEGISGMMKAVPMFFSSFFIAIRTSLKDPDDQRIIW